MIGSKEATDLVTELEACCKEMSSKPVKVNKKNEVKFDFKIKGQKPIVTKEVIQFNITGADFKAEKVQEILAKHKIVELE